jgi:uncharacterized protein
MATRSLTIRGIPEATLDRLRARAARQHRSLNGELLAILARAAEEEVRPPGGAVRETAAAHQPVAGAASESAARRAGGGGDSAEDQPASASLIDDVDSDVLAGVCRQHHIRWLAVFGSHARGEARADSDVDVVVEFAPGMTPGLGIVRVADALRPVFGGRRVDLVTRRGLAPRLRDRVLAEARELYAAG